MFLESSRYAGVATLQVKTRDGREVQALTLRRLPAVSGAPTTIQGNDRLDVMAYQRYGDGTRFWRIADANTALQANDLAAEAGRTIEVPER